MAHVIEMPKLSDTMSSGTLVTWLKQEGDAVDIGEMIAEVETDKATMEVEAFEEGVMLKHYVKEGDQVDIGGAICAIGEKGEEAPDAGSSGSDDATSSEDEDEDEDEAEEPEEKDDSDDSDDSDEDTGEDKEASDAEEKNPKKESKPSGEKSAKEGSDEKSARIKASPLARKLAEDRGIDLKSVKGSGPGGRIVKADVAKAEKDSGGKKAEAASKAPALSATDVLGEDQELPVSNMRATIARALVASKSEAPHFYLQMEVDAGPLSRFRQELNEKLAEVPPEQGGAKFSVNDLILKASAEAVRRVPAINRSWQKDKMIQYGSVHLGFAVAIEDGLVTPVIRNAETKTLRAISREARELGQRAKNRKLKPDEMQNSTLTVSNLGMFGISDFYGIINPPNAAILSIGAAIKTPVFDENGQVVPGFRMKIGLSGDHRSIDGAVGALYLQALRELLETPGTMLV